MKARILLFVLFPVILYSCSSSKLHNRSVVDMSLQIDTAAAISQSGILPVGLNLTLYNGKNKATMGVTNGTWGWHRFNIAAENALFMDGKVVYDKEDVLVKNKPIKLFVQPRNTRMYTDTFTINIPRPLLASIYYDEEKTVKAPGNFVQTYLTVVFDNGKVINSYDNNGQFLWNLFTLKHNGAVLNNGILYIPHFAPTFIEKIPITAQYLYDSTIQSTQEITLDYKAVYNFNFDGQDGHKGNSGSNAYGKRGRDGRNGSNGGSGGNGQNGNTVKIYCYLLEKDEEKYLVVKMQSWQHLENTIINVNGGKIELSCRGGRGGGGGSGGDGSPGADAKGNDPAGQGGNGGDGGPGGNGGNGGTVYIYADEAAAAYLNLLVIDNNGGGGGGGGSAGSSGRGGSDPNAKALTALLGYNRGYTGNKGQSGNSGMPGETIKNIVSTENLLQMMELEKQAR